MKFIASTIITSLLAFSLGLFFPWWTVAVAGMLTGFFIPQGRFLSLFSSLLGVFLLWAGMAFFMSLSNDHILAKKISLMILKSSSPLLLIFVSALIGGLVAGVSAFSGRSLALLFQKN